MEALGEIAFDYAFNTEPILRLEIAAERIIRFLLDRFAPAVVSDTGEPQNEVEEKLMALISDNYKVFMPETDSRRKSCISGFSL